MRIIQPRQQGRLDSAREQVITMVQAALGAGKPFTVVCCTDEAADWYRKKFSELGLKCDVQVIG